MRAIAASICSRRRSFELLIHLPRMSLDVAGARQTGTCWLTRESAFVALSESRSQRRTVCRTSSNTTYCSSLSRSLDSRTPGSGDARRRVTGLNVTLELEDASMLSRADLGLA